MHAAQDEEAATPKRAKAHPPGQYQAVSWGWVAAQNYQLILDWRVQLSAHATTSQISPLWDSHWDQHASSQPKWWSNASQLTHWSLMMHIGSSLLQVKACHLFSTRPLTWTNADLLLMWPNEHISVKFETNWFISENAFENVSSKMSAILFRPELVEIVLRLTIV